MARKNCSSEREIGGGLDVDPIRAKTSFSSGAGSQKKFGISDLLVLVIGTGEFGWFSGTLFVVETSLEVAGNEISYFAGQKPVIAMQLE